MRALLIILHVRTCTCITVQCLAQTPPDSIETTRLPENVPYKPRRTLAYSQRATGYDRPRAKSPGYAADQITRHRARLCAKLCAKLCCLLSFYVPVQSSCKKGEQSICSSPRDTPARSLHDFNVQSPCKHSFCTAAASVVQYFPRPCKYSARL